MSLTSRVVHQKRLAAENRLLLLPTAALVIILSRRKPTLVLCQGNAPIHPVAAAMTKAVPRIFLNMSAVSKAHARNVSLVWIVLDHCQAQQRLALLLSARRFAVLLKSR